MKYEGGRGGSTMVDTICTVLQESHCTVVAELR